MEKMVLRTFLVFSLIKNSLTPRISGNRFYKAGTDFRTVPDCPGTARLSSGLRAPLTTIGIKKEVK
jgi:hypothetical protein